MDDGVSPYSPKALNRAVNLAAVLGWAGFILPDLIRRPEAILGLPFLALWGLPIAFGLCWLIARPVLKRLMKKPVSWRKAAAWGAVFAAIFAAISIAIFRTLGYLQSINPNSYSRIGPDGAVRSIDGILTPYGWWVLALNTAEFIALGAIVGLAVRWIIGPGTEAKTQD